MWFLHADFYIVFSGSTPILLSQCFPPASNQCADGLTVCLPLLN